METAGPPRNLGCEDVCACEHLSYGIRELYSISMRSRCWPRRAALKLRPPAALAAALVWLLASAFPPPSLAQVRTAPTSDALADAARAYAKGDYESVEQLTTPLAGNADAVVLRARALSARGRYEDAIRLLTPLADASPAGEAALRLGILLHTLGRRDDAVRRLEAVLTRNAESQDGTALGRAAQAARWLGRFQQANDLFRDAAVIATDDPALQTAWGDLLLEKHNALDASRSYRQAIQIDRAYAPAFLGLARVVSDNSPPAARELVGRVLRMNPSLVEAHVLLAELELDDDQTGAAREALSRALAVNPSSLEARSLVAAIAAIEGRMADFEREVAGVLAMNPRYAAVYRVAGQQLAHHYRFEEAVELTRKAAALDPDDARTRAELGMHLLRTGDEAGARETLDAAFRLDPYDVVTYNLLGLLDTLDKFVTVEDGSIVMRLDPDEAPVLREHAMPLAREALRTLSARYGVTPQAPILVEIFPRHDDFAVRNLGLPGMIGALGACFGRVVTLDSPRARPPGTFNWQATLWHEMAHVVTLQLSRQRVPRWLTEGISVFEEQRARPQWGRDMQLQFAEAMEQGAVLPLADLNRGFSDPDTIALAYYEASLVVDHIVSAYGDEGLRALLRAYADDLDTPAAVQRALGVSLPQLQASFDAALEKQFSAIRTALEPPPDSQLAHANDIGDLMELVKKYPGSYPARLALAQAHEDAGDDEAAMAQYDVAARLVPVATGEDSPRARIVALALKTGDQRRAARALESLLAYDHVNVEAARQLLTLLAEPADHARILETHSRIVELDPYDSASSSALGREALKAGDAEGAAKWFRAALASSPRDPVSAHCDLADAYVRAGAADQAKRQVLAALEIAPTYARAQDLLLSIVEGAP